MFKFYFTTPIFRLIFLAFLLTQSLSVAAYKDENKLSQKLQNRLLTTKAQETITLFIYFKDKGDNIEEKLLRAKAELSPRALRRRVINRGADNVVSFTDIPIAANYLSLIKTQVTKIRHPLKAINAVSVEATPAAIENILKYDFVQRVELVNKLRRKPLPQTDIAIPKKSQDVLEKQLSSAFALDYGNSFTQNNQINIPAVHDLGYDGTGVVIALFDSGFNRLTHETFAQMTIAAAWDFVNDDSDVGDGVDMGIGSHGTNTLSTIGGYSPGNLIGPAYGATYYLAKTENTDSELHVEEDNWCAAAEWADDNGVQIISSSLGYTVFDSGVDYTPSDMDGDTTIVTRCADLVAENGIVVINSIGNSGSGTSTLGAPSDGDLVIAVGAVESSGVLSFFSSVGPTSDGRIKPDVSAMGSGVTVASALSDSGYFLADGTSFACPLTAGVAALILEANNTLTAEQVRDILLSSANKTLTPDNSTGYGIIDALAAVEFASQAVTGNFPPNASFAVTTNEAVASFVSTSTDTDGNVTSFEWDFGDGSSSNLENVEHSYTTSGSYSVSMTVSDNDGFTDTVSRVVSVNVPPAATPPPTQNSSSGGGSLGVYMAFGLLVLLGYRNNFNRMSVPAFNIVR